MAKKNINTSRRGVASVWIAIMGFLLIVLAALASDTGLVVLGNEELQHAADAAALAGAAKLRTGTAAARDAAIAIALANKVRKTAVVLDRNDGNGDGGDIVVGRYNRSVSPPFDPTSPAPNAVQVNPKRTAAAHGGLPLIFGSAFGVSTVDSDRRTATAITSANGVIVLDPTEHCALTLNGNGIISITDISVNLPAAIQVNSSDSCAVCTNGTNPTIEASDINVVGDACISGANFDGEVHPGSSAIPDPLASLPAPPPGTTQTSPDKKGNVTIPPGYYPNGITRNKDMLTLSAGIYTLGGAGLDLSGQASITGSGVMLYITGTGKVNVSGQGSLQLSAVVGGAYDGIVFYQDRGNNRDATLTGQAMNITGILYFPSNHLDLKGTGGSDGNQIIADTLTIVGNGAVGVSFVGTDALGTKVYLIE